MQVELTKENVNTMRGFVKIMQDSLQLKSYNPSLTSLANTAIAEHFSKIKSSKKTKKHEA